MWSVRIVGYFAIFCTVRTTTTTTFYVHSRFTREMFVIDKFTIVCKYVLGPQT